MSLSGIPSRAGAAVWLTGLPCSGKTTIGIALTALIGQHGAQAVLLDGDMLRAEARHDLGFSADDRVTQAVRAATRARDVLETGAIAVVALVSPLEVARDAAKAILGPAYIEVHIDAPVEVCAARDPKGMYALARAGRIAEFTGVSAPYERPRAPARQINAVDSSPGECAAEIIDLLRRRGSLAFCGLRDR